MLGPVMSRARVSGRGEGGVVGDVVGKEELFDHGVAAADDGDFVCVCVFGLDVAGLSGDGGEGEEAV